jgi:hypothetical protein
MQNKTHFKLRLPVLILPSMLLTIVFFTKFLESSMAAPTVTLSTTPNTSEAAENVLIHIADVKSIPIDELVVVNDHSTTYLASGREFQLVTVLGTRPDGRFYDLLVDLSSGRIYTNTAVVRKAEEQAYHALYGKLDPALYERLQDVGDTEELPVAIWVSGAPAQTLVELQKQFFGQLAVKHPEIPSVLEYYGKPADVGNPRLEQEIEDEYLSMLTMQMQTRTHPVVTKLEQQGFAVNTYPGMPSFTVVLPKWKILEMNNQENVSAIYLSEGRERPELDSSVPTHLAPLVWNQGYDGSGVTIAILENGNVDPDNHFLHLSTINRVAGDGVQGHTTRVASCAASFADTLRGMAPGATILSAGENGQQDDVVEALRWAVVTQTAHIVNYSGGFDTGNDVAWLDRAFDYWSRARFRLVVKSAGNTGNSITSPGKAWNVLTVGAADDNNTSVWSDDQMWSDSSYVNPSSTSGDREKPEVVAIGASVTSLSIGDVPVTRSGTSYAAPQVAGLAALLIDHNSSLTVWPEATKAIIMASATHNIEGPSGIPTGQDLRDGAGAINAVLADAIAQNRNTSDSDPCETSCWWGTHVGSLAEGEYLYRYFDANAGQQIRVAIVWWSNADSPGNNYSFDRLDTDLHLGVQYYDGVDWDWVDGAWSASADNNYELLDFMTTETGAYRIAVYKAHIYNSESINPAGIALLTLHRIYLPLTLRNTN